MRFRQIGDSDTYYCRKKGDDYGEVSFEVQVLQSCEFTFDVVGGAGNNNNNSKNKRKNTTFKCDSNNSSITNNHTHVVVGDGSSTFYSSTSSSSPLTTTSSVLSTDYINDGVWRDYAADSSYDDDDEEDKKSGRFMDYHDPVKKTDSGEYLRTSNTYKKLRLFCFFIWSKTRQSFVIFFALLSYTSLIRNIWLTRVIFLHKF